jgi:predicted Zn-dependent protease
VVSDDRLIPIAAREYRQILAKEKLSTNRAEIREVQEVGERISLAAEKYLALFGRSRDIAGYRWEFNLIDSPEANAFCLPGGKVAVYSGLLPITQNEAGLAAVIGHEVAHAIAHHAAERASQRLLTGLGGQILDIGLSASGTSAGSSQAIMIAFGLGSQYGFLLPFSRTHEKEADRIGLSLMAMAGYDPDEAIKFWDRMAKASGRGKSRLEFLSTHPADQTRISNLRAFLPEAKSRYVPMTNRGDLRSVRSTRGARDDSPAQARPQKNQKPPPIQMRRADSSEDELDEDEGPGPIQMKRPKKKPAQNRSRPRRYYYDD